MRGRHVSRQGWLYFDLSTSNKSISQKNRQFVIVLNRQKYVLVWTLHKHR